MDLFAILSNVSVKFGDVNIKKNKSEDRVLRNSLVDEILVDKFPVNHKLKHFFLGMVGFKAGLCRAPPWPTKTSPGGLFLGVVEGLSGNW